MWEGCPVSKLLKTQDVSQVSNNTYKWPVDKKARINQTQNCWIQAGIDVL